MAYIEHAIKMVVSEDENETFTQAMTEALERMQKKQEVTFHVLEWREKTVSELGREEMPAVQLPLKLDTTS